MDGEGGGGGGRQVDPLREEGSPDLIARVSPKVAAGDGNSISEEMLGELIHSAIHDLPNVKAFVAKLLLNDPSLSFLRRVLDQAFLSSLETVKDLLRKYASQIFRAAGNDARVVAACFG
uniref:Uncharacterized protein LOC105055966 n=1 Tax=Elaeis guineensis var. tenera TaxID=51953 RepID=A0A8N4F323_ELAGV|nr:uncharacterized protein LOC105055966 [Elaeis guineensis]